MSDAVRRVASGLSSAFLAGEWERVAMTRRGQRAVAQRRVWVRDLAAAACHAYPQAPRDRPRELTSFLGACPPLVEAFSKARQQNEPPIRVQRWFLADTAMGPSPWPVPRLDTVRDLQDLLGLTTSKLEWFADPKALERHTTELRLRHYRYRWAAKSAGGVRMIEEPKPVLKHIQRVILREILGPIPVHDAAHGFVTGRSVLSYVSGHAGRAVIVHLDLEDFFGSVTAGRIFGIFRRCGYPENVAHRLTALATNSVPERVWANAPAPSGELRGAHRRLGQHLAHPHLPQGAPTSPALANLAANRLDRRLSGLAADAGFTYSRYADDLALSSTTRRSGESVAKTIELVTHIAADEGFRINTAKTAVRRSGQRQRLTGVVVNRHSNVDRRDYDRLKATLTNAARYGPASQNREQHPHYRDHLLGRVGWVRCVNPERGDRLQAVFEQIAWD